MTSTRTQPTHAVIIPHYNDIDRLSRCLEALLPQAGPETEIIVVDNASPVSMDPIRERFDQVRVLTQPEKGAGPARNMGVAHSTAPWILFIDADCVPAPDWLAVGKRIARPDQVIGGRVDVFHETPPPQSGAEAFETVFAFKMQAYLERDAFLGAGNLVLPRALFDDVGGFRPAVAEDKEWSQRAARGGYTLAYDDDFVVSHPSRQDWPALRHKWQRMTSEGFLLLGGGRGGRLKWALKALAMPLSVLAHGPRIVAHRGLSLREKGAALATLLRIRLARMGWMLRQAMTGNV